jgi:hypothetical protein
MATEEHLARLKQGVAAWNQWRSSQTATLSLRGLGRCGGRRMRHERRPRRRSLPP